MADEKKPRNLVSDAFTLYEAGNRMEQQGVSVGDIVATINLLIATYPGDQDALRSKLKEIIIAEKMMSTLVH